MSDVVRGRRGSAAPAALATVMALGLWLLLRHPGSGGGGYVGLPLCMGAFLLVQLLFPVVRWRRETVLGPSNVAFLLFATLLLVIPVLIMAEGAYRGSLRVLPPTSAVNTAAAAQALAYLGFGLGATFSRPRPRRWTSCLPSTAPDAWVLTCVVLALGMLGTGLAFGSPRALLDYFQGRAALGSSGPTTVVGAAATFLRPFLSWGFVLAWCSRRARPPAAPSIGWHSVNVALVGASIAATATFSYNRAAVVVPLLALITAVNLHVRRFRPVLVLLVVVLVVLASYQFGGYRAVYTGTQGGKISARQANLGHRTSLSQQVQQYGNGPQFWGVVVDDVSRRGYRLGGTVPSSALLPVPVLGKPFRTSSGPTAYNRIVYGRPGIVDQILPLGAELWWNFGAAGVFGGFMMVGAAVRRCEVRAAEATDLLGCYLYTYVGAWCALSVINSLSVLTQVFVYFMWPVALILVVRRRADRRVRHRQPA